jgi:16S rRNA (adenine1518-N6/adenine1519-N6)-dimethyltransferase
LSHRPRKRFGQHFLHDANVIARIVAAIDPRPGDRLVEIGPGLGALSLPLLQRAGRLEVVEIDRDVVGPLRETCAGHGELVIHQGDALAFDFAALAGSGPRLRVCGNLPYNISTPLLFHFLDQADLFRDAHVMLQKEVVQRICAEPGGKTYGRLTVTIGARCRPELLFTISPGCFSPPPRVDSAFLRLTPHPAGAIGLMSFAALNEVVTRAFGLRRKRLANALKGLLSEPEIVSAGLDPGSRPEQVDVAGFVRLANLRAGHAS